MATSKPFFDGLPLIGVAIHSNNRVLRKESGRDRVRKAG